MQRKSTFIVLEFILSLLLLTSCNLPSRQPIHTQTPTPIAISIATIDTPTPAASLCDNQYFPNSVGDSWEYSGNNTATGTYTRTDTITNSDADAFSMESKLAGMTYSVEYTCTIAGLIAVNPIQQYLGALLTGPDAPVNVILISNSGISLPAKITPGDSWQQMAEWEASAKDFAMNGRFVFNYTAAGYESITVPYGSFDALRVNAIIRVEISSFRILAGTYETITWMVPNVGIIKSEGSSHVPGLDFADSLELTSYTPSP